MAGFRIFLFHFWKPCIFLMKIFPLNQRKKQLERFCQELLIHPSQKDPEPDALGASSAPVPLGKEKLDLLHLS